MYLAQTRITVWTLRSREGVWSLDKKVFSVYLGDPDRSNHAELDLPATPWELIDALDKLRLEDGREPYWQVEVFLHRSLMTATCISSTLWRSS